MYLRFLDLENFRSFSDERIYFEKRLTVLVGENNGGKSNIIDAIRLATAPLSGRREIYCESTDIRFGVKNCAFEIQTTFEELSPPQQGRLLSATIDDTLCRARFGLSYDATDNRTYVRPKFWAGKFKTTPEPGSHDMIRHVYLPPLRDAKRALASGNPTRINALLNHFLGDRAPDEVAKSLSRTSDDKILTDVDLAVASGLDVLTAGVRQQNASLGFNSDEKLIDIARDLRFKLADHGIAPEDLQYSGHGYANLLYIATIAVELERTNDAELTLFLVEEPEAHLHPQLQAAVLNFLEERAEKSLEPNTDSNAPAGHIQVIVATHSPNLTAWVPNENLVFIRTVELDKKPPEALDEAAPDDLLTEASSSSVKRAESRSIPLSQLDLTNADRRKIDRYLDVTKSALLFGGRVFLVEGIAEALLLPIIAKYFVLKDRPKDLRVFRSAVFVPIDGVDFEPYAKILLSPFKGVQIAERLVIVTDGDKHTVEEGKTSPGENRKTKLLALVKERIAEANLQVFINSYSLETELITAGNETCIKEVYLGFHPRSEAKWIEALQGDGSARATKIQALFENTPKGDFAHCLAEKISDSDSFVIPDYLKKAIEALVQ